MVDSWTTIFFLLSTICSLYMGMFFALLGLFIDQFFKHFAQTRLASGESLWSVGSFSFTNFENTTGPFSLPIPQELLILVAMLLLVALWFRKRATSGRLQTACALIFAGGFSNFLDRTTLGATVDYLGLPFGGFWNLADVMIVVGIVMLVSGSEKKLKQR